MLRIRKAGLRDFSKVYTFINELENTIFDRKKQLRIFRQNLTSSAILYLVAVQQGEVVGFLSCHIQWLLHHNAPVAEIQEMFVDASMRSKNVGKKLLDDLKQRMQKKGVHQIEAVSNMKRKRAHNFYIREGFRMTSSKFVFIEKSL